MRAARLEVARKMGFVRRAPLDEQASKSRVKRALLRAMYGEHGQIENRAGEAPSGGGAG